MQVPQALGKRGHLRHGPIFACTLPTVDTIVLVDPESERLRVLQRTGPNSWNDTMFDGPAALDLPSLNVTIPHNEIFARD